MFRISPEFARVLRRLNLIACLIAATTAATMILALARAPVPVELCYILQDNGPYMFVPYFFTSMICPVGEQYWPKFMRSALASAFVAVGFAMTMLMEMFVAPRSSTSVIGYSIVPFVSAALFVIGIPIHTMLSLFFGTRVSFPTGDPTCERCGYCLHGNMSGICPECGCKV